MEQQVIVTKDLSLKAGHRYLLNHISWQVNRGENWVVFGMNGSGKTTLLSILAGFRQGSSGNVEVLGACYKQENILDLRKRIGWVSSSFFDQMYSQEAPLDIVLSGKFGTLGIDGTVESKDIKRAKILLKKLNLAEKMYRPFNVLSKGERQNVLIARALMGDPELLMLDEPCTGLDIGAREYLLEIVRSLAETGDITMVYVTHHMDEILPEVFEHTMLLKNGGVYKTGKTEEIFTDEIMEQFLETPCQIEQSRVHGFEIHVNMNWDAKGLLMGGKGV